jgi:hypothetical protein
MGFVQKGFGYGYVSFVVARFRLSCYTTNETNIQNRYVAETKTNKRLTVFNNAARLFTVD